MVAEKISTKELLMMKEINKCIKKIQLKKCMKLNQKPLCLTQDSPDNRLNCPSIMCRSSKYFNKRLLHPLGNNKLGNNRDACLFMNDLCQPYTAGIKVPPWQLMDGRRWEDKINADSPESVVFLFTPLPA